MLLMQINYRIMAMKGIKRAAILMGTEPNKRLLAKNGFEGNGIEKAGPSDMVIGLEADDETIMESALALALKLLKSGKVKLRSGVKSFATLDAAVEAYTDANLVLISTPGQFAAREARKALSKKCNVFIFSDNVPIEEEIELKRKAEESGLLVMGPDCGTAIIDGIALGFANNVPRGSVGIIGAAGTGIQELTVLLDRFGKLGISQAIGVGGRDLSEAVQGLSTVQAIRLLSANPLTDCLVLISKPPSEKVARKLILEAGNSGKPVIVCFLGERPGQAGYNLPSNIIRVTNIEEAALETIKRFDKRPMEVLISAKEIDALAQKEAERLSSGQKFVRGIFSGGSLCYEAMSYLRDAIKPIYCNTPISGTSPIADVEKSLFHTFLDMGDDNFTLGKVHPMIDPTSVAERIRIEAENIDVGVILFDVVLGYGAHLNPSEILTPAVEEARKNAEARGRYLAVICHVCGTEHDPQDSRMQEEALRSAGALTMSSNLEACRLTAAIINIKKGGS
jgi:succinyl-CoA synthetase alpha subunit